MLQISETDFFIDTHPRDRVELERHALVLFERYESLLNLQLRLDDYAIEFDLENGSLLGKGRVWATVGGIYLFVCGYGAFSSGIEAMASHAKAVGEFLASEAPKLLGEPGLKTTKKHSSAGQLGDLQKLFRQVQRGKLDPDAAARLALKIFAQSDEELPAGLSENIKQSFLTLERYPVQDTLFALGEDTNSPSPAVPSPTNHKPREAHPVLAENGNRLRIEIRRSGKNREKEITFKEVPSKTRKTPRP